MAEAQSGTGQLQEQKKGLLIAVSASVDKIISHFGAARNLVQKAQLGDSRLSPDVGHLVLTTLCPALHALVADGLKPFRKDLITGQRRSSPWSVVEASVKPGASSRALGTLYGQVSRLGPLSSSRSRFHAFILGLLKAVRALCDHTAAGPDQLSFRRGEVLRVVATVDEDWLRCGQNGVEGLVPVGYTSLVL